MQLYDDERDSKRSLTPRQREFVYIRAKKRCENPLCRKKLEFHEMQIGHKTKAWSKGGKTTITNSVCLCYGCNNLQGIDSWATFLKKRGYEDPKVKMKKALSSFTVQQLRALAAKHNVKVKGKIIEDFFASRRAAPTKSQYVNALAIVVTEKELSSLPREEPKPAKRKKRRKSDSLW